MSAEYPLEKCLLTMPDVVMNKLLGLLDFPAVQCLRKTCHTMRNFIGAVKLDSALINLYITVEPNSITSLYFFHETSIEVKYCRNGEGCDVEWRGRDNRTQKKLLESEDFVDVASRDIISVLTDQKSVMKSLKLDTFRCPNDILEEQQELLYEVSQQFLSNLESHLASKPRKLQVKTFRTKVVNVAQVLHILPHLDVKNLAIGNGRKVNYDAVLNIQQLIELEQWKKLDTLNIYRFCVDLRVGNLVHLKKCFVKYETVDTAMIEELKEAFRTSSHLEFFRIEHGQPDIQHLMDPRYAGPHIHSDQFDHVTHSWFFSVSTPKRVLNVSLCPYEIEFDLDWLVNVPEAATIN
ncbi:hypothetical protein CRE_13623 [Caenorhabditis remanei]|uniref:DUF38 domain-containing protein n=1 Tax=Caenorhabditis remanei TaxID=31234 RepID=E3N1B5_CAERE|nr:hypothetical protein CRE_13623 [Caenorhabditis remanei]